MASLIICVLTRNNSRPCGGQQLLIDGLADLNQVTARAPAGDSNIGFRITDCVGHVTTRAPAGDSNDLPDSSTYQLSVTTRAPAGDSNNFVIIVQDVDAMVTTRAPAGDSNILPNALHPMMRP